MLIHGPSIRLPALFCPAEALLFHVSTRDMIDQSVQICGLQIISVLKYRSHVNTRKLRSPIYGWLPDQVVVLLYTVI